MNDYIDSLGDTQLFPKSPSNSGYLNIELDKADREKTTFSSYRGLRQLTRMPFALKNIPS